MVDKLFIVMAGDDIFVYLGGDQEVPMDVKHVVIDRSVKIIPLSFDVPIYTSH